MTRFEVKGALSMFGPKHSRGGSTTSQPCPRQSWEGAGIGLVPSGGKWGRRVEAVPELLPVLPEASSVFPFGKKAFLFQDGRNVGWRVSVRRVCEINDFTPRNKELPWVISILGPYTPHGVASWLVGVERVAQSHENNVDQFTLKVSPQTLPHSIEQECLKGGSLKAAPNSKI